MMISSSSSYCSNITELDTVTPEVFLGPLKIHLSALYQIYEFHRVNVTERGR